ncbi:hypothetical protein Bca52824_049588 [Brassica carinata]|uniref:Uncharacterized protein n=1 Tax=Brassica carinata TaxID=52824 RepID=A0A8X7RJ17_BRACI|nr:hypothetical protein Bca52824_049588 [Brassica carinata]
MIHTSEGGGKMDWNDPVVVEEDEEETTGPKDDQKMKRRLKMSELTFSCPWTALCNFMSCTCSYMSKG